MFSKKVNTLETDYVIIGAGIFGLYAASLLVKKKKRVVILESGQKIFSRASAINQARLHNGYHYPRSFETASKAAQYYDRFIKEFSFAITNSFKQVYAIASEWSKISANEFIEFCRLVGIPLKSINDQNYFKKGAVEAAFLVKECGFDYRKIRDFLFAQITGSAHIIYNSVIQSVRRVGNNYELTLKDDTLLRAPVIINATYANVNTIIEKFALDTFDLKYELCEIALCKVSKPYEHAGVTVMDGDYFSVMPFGSYGLHSLTSVGYTPHYVSNTKIPTFISEKAKRKCSVHNTKQCIICAQPVKSAWQDMYDLGQKFLKDDFKVKYKKSLYEIKPVLKISEDDDSRPTIIRQHSSDPTLISILSGKISGIFDLDKIL